MASSQRLEKPFTFAAMAALASALLASAPYPTTAAAAIGPQPAALAYPARLTPVDYTQAGLTSAQIQKLRSTAMGPKGYGGGISPAVASALGLGEHDRTIYFRSFSLKNATTGVGYQIHLLPNESGYLISHWDGKTNTIFRLGAQLNFVASTGSGYGGEPVYPLPQDQVNRIYEAEISFWRTIADSIND